MSILHFQLQGLRDQFYDTLQNERGETTLCILLSVGHQKAPLSQILTVFFLAPNILPFGVIRKFWYGKL